MLTSERHINGFLLLGQSVFCLKLTYILDIYILYKMNKHINIFYQRTTQGKSDKKYVVLDVYFMCHSLCVCLFVAIKSQTDTTQRVKLTIMRWHNA